MSFKQCIIFLVVVSLVSEQVSGHPLLGLMIAKAHVAPKIALKAVHAKARGAFLLGTSALVKGAIIAKPLLIKGAIIAGKVHLFNHLRSRVAIKPYKHTYPTYTHSYGKKVKTTGYGGVHSTSTAARTMPSLLPPIIPSITLPEVNVPVRLSVGGSGGGIMNNMRNTNNDDLGFNSSLDNNDSSSNSSSKQ